MASEGPGPGAARTRAFPEPACPAPSWPWPRESRTHSNPRGRGESTTLSLRDQPPFLLSISITQQRDLFLAAQMRSLGLGSAPVSDKRGRVLRSVPQPVGHTPGLHLHLGARPARPSRTGARGTTETAGGGAFRGCLRRSPSGLDEPGEGATAADTTGNKTSCSTRA